jgi:hypothetical protein
MTDTLNPFRRAGYPGQPAPYQTGLDQFMQVPSVQPSTNNNTQPLIPTYNDREFLHPGLKPTVPPKTAPPPDDDRAGLVPLPRDGGLDPPPKVRPTPVLPEPPMSTGYPAVPVDPTRPQQAGTGTQAGAGALGLDFMRQVTPNELVANQLQGLLESNSPYMQNARQRGVEYAASRGGLNSSIAAGASQRAAIEAGMPIAQSDAGVYRDANQGNFESLSQLRQMRVAGELENWLSSETYNRDFNGRLAMIPINSGADMLQYITQRALEDPAVYTPDVISGFNNFFNLNMQNMFRNFFSGGKPSGGG